MLSYLEINKNNVISNLNEIKKNLIKGQEIAVVLKANAYGHGQNEMAKILENRVEYIQLDDIEELRSLRSVSEMPVLLLGYIMDDELEEAVMLNSIVTIYDGQRLNLVNEIGKKLGSKVPIHIKIDSFLGRQGLLPDSVDAFITRLTTSQNVFVHGIYAHFSDADNLNNMAHTKKQLGQFKTICKKFENAGVTGFKKHMSATSGFLLQKELNEYFDIVRIGLALYGQWPSTDLSNTFSNDITLTPVLKWVTHVAQVKTLPKDHPVGYGLTYITTKETKIAVIPQGYSDGYDRGLSNVGCVLIRGHVCNVIGRIAMNMFVVDITNIPNVSVSDEVVLLGSQGSREITADSLAEKISTISYEIIARISPLLPRIIV